MNSPDYYPEEVEKQTRAVLEMHEQHQYKIDFFGTKDRTASKVGMRQKAISKRRSKNKASRKARKAS